MPDNEPNTGPTANVTASSGSSVTPAAGPLVVSETNPATSRSNRTTPPTGGWCT
jgi:hypothetical protein